MTLQELYAEALADVESGEAARRPCRTTPECSAAGCPRCVSGLMRSADIGIRQVVVNRRTGSVTLMIDADHGKCTLVIKGVEVICE